MEDSKGNAAAVPILPHQSSTHLAWHYEFGEAEPACLWLYCSGGSDGHQDGAGGPPQRARQLGYQLRRSLQLEDGHLLRRRLRLRLVRYATLFVSIPRSANGLGFVPIFLHVLRHLQRIAQPELVREIVTRHRQPHQAAICVSLLIPCRLPLAL